MPTLDWQVTRADGVTFVQVAVESDTERSIRVDNRLDGPVWPPRAEGLPAPGWDEGGYEGTVPADRPLVLGYASPADPCEPPVELTDRGRPTASEQAHTPQEIVHALGEAGPPRAAVPRLGHAEDEPAGNGRTPGTDGSVGSRPGTQSTDTAPAAPPSEIELWLDALERRVDRAERLADVSSVAAAREAIAAAGGMAAVRGLGTRLEADRAALDRVRARVGELERRLEVVTVPTETLERLE